MLPQNNLAINLHQDECSLVEEPEINTHEEILPHKNDSTENQPQFDQPILNEPSKLLPTISQAPVVLPQKWLKSSKMAKDKKPIKKVKKSHKCCHLL